MAAARAVDLPARPTVNVVTAAAATGDATLTEEGYAGPDAAACGHLAAALSVVDATDGVALHHGDPDFLRPGPWFVLAPLSGFVATVARGTATATVTVPCSNADAIDHVRDRLDAVLSTARVRHDHYPVADDPRGVFRTGMTTFSFVEATVDDALRVRFAVSTTPATTERAIRSRFAAADALPAELDETAVDVDVTFGTGVERADPPATVRTAVEDAHRAVVGDAQYEWLPDPSVFSRIPGPEKVAFGGGQSETAFDHATFDRTRSLLRAAVDRLGGHR